MSSALVQGKCILCKQSAKLAQNAETMPFDCPRCGRFYATSEFSDDVAGGDSALPALSAATRRASDRGRPLTLTTKTYSALRDEHRWTSVQEKARMILEWIRARSSYFTQAAEIDPSLDYPLFDAVSGEECRALLEHLSARRLITTGEYIEATGWQLTMAGWDFIEPLTRGGIPGRCFVAMAFAPELDAAYLQGIKAAIIEAGYEPVCMKERLTNDNVCDVILAEIRKAQFIVADFTMQKGGVYFEAGFAKALGKELFWLCRDDDFDNLHFDTNHYGHIKWTQPADLRRQLTARIVGELGQGPHTTVRM
jgi:hypothetical protein